MTKPAADLQLQILASSMGVGYVALPMATYRVLVSDPISEKGVDALRSAPGITVDVKTGLTPDELLSIMANTTVLWCGPKPR
jgi:hypothetical protein